MAQSIATDAAQASTIYESAERLVDNAWGKFASRSSNWWSG